MFGIIQIVLLVEGLMGVQEFVHAVQEIRRGQLG